MSKETYFLIKQSDGDVSVTELSATELINRLEEDYYGCSSSLNFIQNLKRDDKEDIMYWSYEDILIIKGQYAKPEPIEKVVRYKL